MLREEWAPSLSFGKAHPPHLLLGTKLQESGGQGEQGWGSPGSVLSPWAALSVPRAVRAVRERPCGSSSSARSSLRALARAAVKSGAPQPFPQSPPSDHSVLGWYLLF